MTRALSRLRARSRSRGMTLLEVLVSLGVLAMISLLIYGAFDSMSRGRREDSMPFSLPTVRRYTETERSG